MYEKVSLKGISKINVVEDSLVLFESNGKAVKEIFSVSLAEWSAVLETSLVGVGVSVVLNSLNNVTESEFSESLLGEDRVTIIHFLFDVGKVSFANISGVHWVTSESLVVWNGPGRGGHNSQLIASCWVDGSEESVLGGEGSYGALDDLLFSLH